jgi:transposase
MLRDTSSIALSELDQKIFDATVPEDHYLRRVLATIDFERSRESLASCYSAHLGRPALEPVLLLKLEFLQYQYDLSDRDVVEQAGYNMAFRYFLGLSLASRLPHHTLLTVFRERLGAEKHQAIFDDLVAQARQRHLVKDRLRLKDATHVVANIAIPTTIALVTQIRDRLLEAVRPYAAERVSAEEAQAEAIAKATSDLANAERLAHRVAHLRAMVTWVESLVADRGPAQEGDDQRAALADALRLAHQVLADRERPKAADQLVSVHDQDARWGRHGKKYAGYLLDIAMDSESEIITQLNLLPANGDEGGDATTLIRQEEQAHGNDVQGLSMDGAGFRGTLLRDCTDPQGLNLQVFTPPPREKPSPYFAAQQFTKNATGTSLTCPAGQTTQNRSRATGQTGWEFSFPRATCQSCALQQQCMAKLPKNKGRTVVKNDYEAEYEAARAKVHTPEYQAARRQHRRIERKLCELVRWHRARRARYRGGLKVKVQMLLTGLVVNVKKVIQSLATKTMRAPLMATG